MAELDNIPEIPLHGPIRFVGYEEPIGRLPDFRKHRGAHALMFYSIIASRHYYTEIAKDPLIYEDERWPETGEHVFKNMLKAASFWYSIPVETIILFWDVVLEQAELIRMVVPLRARLGARILTNIPKPINLN